MGKRYREQEERKELQSTIEIGSTSSDDTLRFHGLATDWPSWEEKKTGRGKEKITVKVDVSVHGQDIFARNQPGKKSTTLWEKFLLFRNHVNKNLISLVNNTDTLVEQYYSFLVNSYDASDRYRNLDMEGKTWLRKVVRLAITYHIMENKLEGYLRSAYDENDDEDYFYNEFAVYFYLLMRTVKLSMKGAAREIHHIIKEPEKADYYLNQFFEGHYQQLRNTPFPQRDNILRLLKANPESNDDKGLAV